MSRKKREAPKPVSRGEAGGPRSAAVSDSGIPTGVLTFVTALLLTARYFLPAESAALGDTLWIVQLWLIAAVAWFWLVARSGEQLRRWDLLDLGLGLMVLGHVVSALIVLMTEGDRRAALNMLWEWIGIAAATWLMREVIRRGEGRRLLDIVVIAGVTLAGFGLWQHHVWYPSLTSKLAEYDQLLTTAPADPEAAVERQDRLRQLGRELGPVLSADDPTAGQLLRARVAASTEPIGRFALANSFAGLLLVVVLLAVRHLAGLRISGPITWRWWVGALLLIGVMYCFWLTKSRTALAGLVVALFGLGLSMRRLGTGYARSKWLIVVVGVPFVLLPVVASLSGGLDRQVITEAPKSLQYRLEYWTATGAVIREQPVFGVGPGNFRQAYLQHKLPGSSEEVLDPHNLLLDVWANGGLLALAGLLILLAAILRGNGDRRDDADSGHAVDSVPISSATRVVSTIAARIGLGVMALLLSAFVGLMSTAGFQEGLWWMMLGWVMVSVVWPMPRSDNSALVGAAALGLVVHLMGAGGIAMPAILQTLLLLGACRVSSLPATMHRLPSEPSATNLPWPPMVAAGVWLSLAMACAFSSTLPVSNARTQVELGRALLQDGSIDRAMRSFESAIEADPLSAEGWQELAIAHASDWRRMASADEDAFARAVQAQQEAIRQNPHSAGGWQMLGDLWWMHYEARADDTSAAEALEAYRTAAGLYPNLATLQAKLAQAASIAGPSDLARDAARRSIDLDDRNREMGHVDKYLPDSTRETLESIINAPAEGL